MGAGISFFLALVPCWGACKNMCANGGVMELSCIRGDISPEAKLSKLVKSTEQNGIEIVNLGGKRLVCVAC